MEGKKVCVHSPTSFCVSTSKIESVGRRNKEEIEGELNQSGKISKKRKGSNDVKSRKEKISHEPVFYILALPAQSPGGDGDENKRKKKRKKEEIVISPYFKEKHMSFMKKCPTQINENKRTKKRESKHLEEESVISPYFKEKNVGFMKKCLTQVDENKRRKKKHLEKEKEEIVISPYFEEKNMSFMKKCTTQVDENKRKKKKHLVKEKEESVISPYFEEKNMSFMKKCTTQVDEKKRKKKKHLEKEKEEIVISPYFEEKNVSANVKKNGNVDQVNKIEKGCLLDDLLSQFAYNKTDAIISNVEKGMGSETENIQRKRGRVVKQHKTESKKLKSVVLSPYFHHKANEICKKARARAATLTAAHKRDEAYQRKTPDNNWTPPRSPFNLLQEDHAFDPWRVFVICMLLNQTTGLQAARVLPNLFQICPHAKTAMKADVNELAEVIHSLGLHKKRAEVIRRLSTQYVDQSWTHVTDLHGVGK